jgi:hypothetical protein
MGMYSITRFNHGSARNICLHGASTRQKRARFSERAFTTITMGHTAETG